jgi:hypothetical protein
VGWKLADAQWAQASMKGIHDAPPVILGVQRLHRPFALAQSFRACDVRTWKEGPCVSSHIENRPGRSQVDIGVQALPDVAARYRCWEELACPT